MNVIGKDALYQKIKGRLQQKNFFIKNDHSLWKKIISVYFGGFPYFKMDNDSIDMTSLSIHYRMTGTNNIFECDTCGGSFS